MKTVFIHIKDISEIDTTKTTVYDLNKRFIDPHGRMYGLRYNRLNKKVEIIRLMRTAAKNANYFTQKMHENQKHTDENPDNDEYKEYIQEEQDFSENDLIKESSEIESSGDFQLESSIKEDGEAEIEFESDLFINNTIKKINVHKERINGIIMNVDNAKLFNHGERNSSIKLENILRNLDIDGIQLIDKVISENKELLEYPRSLNFYIGRLSNRAREIVANQKSNSAKMRFIYLLETYNNFMKLYKNLDKFLSGLLVVINNLDTEQTSKLFATEKQYLDDAKTSIENTLMEIHSIIIDLNKFKKYIYNTNSFVKKI